MRVIAGTARRLSLKTPKGLDTRPTSDRIKETLFNILNPELPGSRFLDLFSGSGGIGIEALSRGAAFAVFVDNSKESVSCIRENLTHTHLLDKSLIINKNVLTGINTLSIKKEKFDIVYIDPPYKKGLEEETLNALSSSGIIDRDSIIIIEADKHNMLDFVNDTDFEITRVKEYKTNKHYFLQLTK